MAERVLIVDDDEGIRDSLALVLSAEAYEVTTAAQATAALECIENTPIDIVLCDLRMPGISGMELLPELVKRLPNIPIIMMSAFGSADLAIEAMKLGAYDYIAKPFQPSEILLTLRKAKEREELRRANQALKRDLQRVVGERPVIAASPCMLELLDMLERAAQFKATVLLTGESGSGKEVLARTIHTQSNRCQQAFVAVNCGAIPDQLLESELFGHVKGAFTGADRTRRGLFAEADRGTLFLDEIAELKPPLQVKLLRVLQEEEIRPVGESKPIHVDVRIIAATSRDIEASVRKGEFREDLYYRLNVIRVKVPPLRERQEDIPLLVNHFLALFSKEMGKPAYRIERETMQHLSAYAWPGNVRELENVIERAVILCKSDTITSRELPSNILGGEAMDAAHEANHPASLSLRDARQKIETELILKALRATNGNRTHAAKLLDISHRALLYKIKEYGISD